MGFFSNLSKGVKKVGNALSKAGKSVVDTTKSAVSTVYKDVKEGVSGALNKATDLLDKGQQRVADLGGKTLDTVGGTIQSLGQSLTMPLLILAGLGAIFVYYNRQEIMQGYQQIKSQ